MKKIAFFVLTLVALAVLYLLAWPVPIAPVAWDAPAAPGYTGPHAVNTRLAHLQIIDLNGEVHDTTVRQHGGVTQVTTGGLLYKGEATYLLGQVYDDRLELDVREFAAASTGVRGELWQLGAYRTASKYQLVPGSAESVGSLTLTAGHDLQDATGKMIPLTRR